MDQKDVTIETSDFHNLSKSSSGRKRKQFAPRKLAAPTTITSYETTNLEEEDFDDSGVVNGHFEESLNQVVILNPDDDGLIVDDDVTRITSS